MATPYGMTAALQAASGYALSALLRIKNLHHFPGHHHLSFAERPDGHPKLPHLWPVKLLQAEQDGL